MNHNKLAEKARAWRAKVATQRHELREPSYPRLPPAGPFCPFVKADDPEIRAMIDRALKQRRRAS